VGNQDTNDVIVFKVDLKTGALTPTDTKIHVGRPICVKFLESHSM
jgi:6-phosphogluconolactonase